MYVLHDEIDNSCTCIMRNNEDVLLLQGTAYDRMERWDRYFVEYSFDISVIKMFFISHPLYFDMMLFCIEMWQTIDCYTPACS